MLTFEALALVYCLALAAAALLLRASRPAWGRAALLSAGVAVIIATTSRTLGPEARGWLGHLYLVAGYWLPALLTGDLEAGAGETPFEAWLARGDARLRGRGMSLPSWARHGLELAYLLCFPLVPLAFWIVWARGDEAEVDRYWTAVLAAGFACYGTLPWLVSRPPRVRRPPPREEHAPASRRVNLFVLARVSHGLNTFPSGHVAVAVAAALIVYATWPAAGLVLAAVAAAIAAGAVAGGYHYLVDVLLGIVLGAAAALVARA